MSDSSDTHGLHFDVHPGDGPPVLVVHGMMAGRALWAANIDALRSVATPVVVELYGHGRSPTPIQDFRYRPETYVAEFEIIRAAVGAERWFVIGQSLGAALTLRYVFDHPDRVIAHVITNSVSGMADSRWRDQISATADTVARTFEEGGLAAVAESRMNPIRARAFHPDAQAGLRTDHALLSPSGLAATMRHTVPTSPVRDRLGENKRPCLVIAGTREAAFAEPLEHIEAVMPLVQVIRLPVGHSPNAEDPDAFNAAVTRFFADHT